ncbi:tetratricopeptide domain-containing protein [Fischerella thermalis JSC-11]|uniref:Tetratricopeptide domain-containing protein n=1 Tax=Fischerella thermalis JSC-11 TaxID=741277 RepID=G6G0C6_9CYAN|nr:CHAT domain-containing protein [Fischerella thermalis]EHC08376.1 tetratricopeptide domain-containing protein [Fischerella thermalis JSC-11]
MKPNKGVFNRNLTNQVKRIYHKRSLFLAVLLFMFASTAPPVIAKVSQTTQIVQTQSDAQQLVNQATQLYRSGQLQEAAVVWEKAVSAFSAQKDNLNQAMALSNLSLTYQQLGQWEKATKANQQSLVLLQTQPQSQDKQKILAQALDIQGYLQKEVGQFTQSLESWQQAAKIYSQIKEPAKLAQNQINQSQVMQDMGLFPRACKTLLEVFNQELGVSDCQEFSQLSSEELTAKLQKITSESPSVTKVIGLRSLGELLRFIGQPEQSQLVLDSSLILAQKLNSPQEQAATYLSIGNTAKTLAENERVRRRRETYYQQAVDAYMQAAKLTTLPTTRQQAQLNHLGLLLKQGKYDPEKYQDAKAFWLSLNPQDLKFSPSRTGIYEQINYAQSLAELIQPENSQQKQNSQLPSFDEIDKTLAEAATQAKNLGDKQAEAYALGNRGALYEQRGSKEDLSQAEKFTRQALNVVSSLESPYISYQYFWQLGRIRKAQGDIPDAIAAYTKAYNALQSLRSDLVAVNPEVQFSFRSSVEPVYRQLVELELEYAQSLKADKKEQESQKRLTQARNVLESLQLAELNNFFREACVETNSKPIDQLDTNAAVVYPIILSNQQQSNANVERLEVILSLPKQPPRLYSTKLKKQEVEETVEQIQAFLKSPETKLEQSLPYYQKVYDWLIRPLQQDLENNKIKTLVFVLDEKLRNIPMSVLHDGKQYLLQKYAIALTPGLQLINPKPLTDINIKAITAGISKPREGFKELPQVRQELKQIEDLGVASKSLLDEKFTTKEVQNQILNSDVSIIHLATHAQFSSIADDTFILFWDQRMNVKQLGNLLRNNTLTSRRPIELLVLSACETAIGDQRATLGLAGVAVRSGARSTMATLWSVQDESTAKFMGNLYSQLEQAKKTKINKAQALQQAQLALLNDQQYSNPHFWAPFVVVGNWQ